MNYKPSPADNIFQAFTRLVEIMLYGSVIATGAAAIINLFLNQ